MILSAGISYMVLQPRVSSSRAQVASLQSRLQNGEAQLGEAQQKVIQNKDRVEKLTGELGLMKMV